MNVKPLLRSFAGGIVGPELLGRIDLVKNQTGLAECVNFWTLPHGPVQNRPGFGYVLEAKNSTKKVRVIPFAFNTEQTFILEFGDQYVRFHTNGGTLLESAQNILDISQPAGLVEITGHGLSNGDWVYLTGIGGMTELNGRYVVVSDSATDTFRMKDFAGNYITTGDYTAYTSGGTAARVYTVTTPYVEDDLFSLHYVQSADVLTITHPSYAPRELQRLGATNWTLTSISFAPTISAPSQPTGATGGPGGGTAIDHFYKTTAIASDGLEESLGSTASAAVNHDLTVAGNYIDVDPTPGGATVTGAVRYNIYKLFNGLYGYIGQTDGSTFRDNNVTPDVSKTPPENSNPFSGTDNYPGAVGYAKGRRAFGGTNNKQQNYWLTRSGTESNLSYSIPTRGDDTIAQRILAREVNRIRHIVSLADLLMLTSGGEWKIAPQNSDILTPDSAAPDQISAEGASDVQPVVTGSHLIYAQDQGGRIRGIKANIYDSRVYDSKDISIMAPHLFDDYTMVDMAYLKAPHKMVFVVRSDGQLLGLTYLPEHEVIAWHEHETDGLFESVAAVREGRETVLYAVIKRTIDSREVRYIERLASRRFTDQEDAFFVDSGLTYDGAASDTITGLWHLEGEEVAILADGAVHPTRTVTDGAITLEQEAEVVHVGLPITADFKTLPIAFEAAAFGQGMKKNVSKVWLRVHESSGIKAGPDYDNLKELAQRTDEPYGSPPRLITGEYPITLSPKWADSGAVCVRQDSPLPLTILSMTLEVAVGG